MKKVLLSIMLVICAVSYVPAQEVATKLGQGELIPNSHLSVSLKAGGSYFRNGGVQFKGPTFFDRSRLDLTSVVGGTIEYTFTPIFGLGLDLSYVGYGRWSDFNQDQVKDNYLKGGTKDAALYASLNLANIIAPNRKGFWSKVSLYGNAGAGMGFYHYETGIHKSLSNANTFLALGGFNLEYNISKAFAIGAEMQYRYYAKDDMGYYANYSPKGFSDAAIATLGLRYKIPCCKDRKHVRNINALEYVPLDGDNDGVPDTQDKCSDTPAGVTVDASGCPVDADADGVADYLDKCAGTPAGVKVDASGCPVDADKDGVADYLDKCPATPAGVVVDKQGCPVDTDKDGIADYLDKCPTVAGVASQNGCPEVVVEKPVLPNLPKVMAISNFVTGSAELVKKFDPILNDLTTFLKANPTTVVELQGNADNRGEEDPNYSLSVRRAKAAAAYLVKKGIKADRISTVGFGETKPVATNETLEGRAANRNCTFVLTSK